MGHGKSEYLGLNEENEKENRDEATQEYGGAVPQTMYNYLQYLSRGDIDRKRERRKSKGSKQRNKQTKTSKKERKKDRKERKKTNKWTMTTE